MFTSLKSVYYKVVEKPLVLRYVMGDADEAQFNTVVDSFGDGNVEYLMRFCHMITKLLWPCDVGVADPDGRYFYRQWLIGTFTKWQCYRTPSAFATTNNPVETFKDTRKKFARCCTPENFFGAKIAELAKSTAKLRWRATELRRMKLIEKMAALPGSYEESDESDYVLVCVHPTPRIYVRPQKQTMEVIEICAQMGLNNARMERDGQPEAGWAVNVRDLMCPCKYFFKHGECVHLYFALYKRYGSDTATWRHRFNRSQRKRKRGLAEDIHDAVVAQQSSRGRPILNGPALSLV
ncbi:hypothetical protein L915_09081 [Phytophthora nicotianae]|uniref:SWIM-type domain-containing protein n=2 Tax=Phytophthora nicotianae TaxID=4792 RepID=W2GTE2_PHYNI|nr:hypothetical protein L915_09081 [Phytophthora nicotianae]